MTDYHSQWVPIMEAPEMLGLMQKIWDQCRTDLENKGWTCEHVGVTDIVKVTPVVNWSFYYKGWVGQLEGPGLEAPKKVALVLKGTRMGGIFVQFELREQGEELCSDDALIELMEKGIHLSTGESDGRPHPDLLEKLQGDGGWWGPDARTALMASWRYGKYVDEIMTP